LIVDDAMTTKPPTHPLRPFVLADTMPLREVFAQSIEELTQDDYDEQQRIAWVSAAEDAQAFGQRLAAMVTLVVQIDGEYAGFASLKDNIHIDMLFVHPYFVGQGVGTTLADALERIAAARGSEAITVDASETAAPFFEERGYAALRRNSVPTDDQWLTNTTMRKSLAPAAKGSDNVH
jgi:putative acetyltransferase